MLISLTYLELFKMKIKLKSFEISKTALETNSRFFTTQLKYDKYYPLTLRPKASLMKVQTKF